MNLTETRRVLLDRHIRLSKSLGQNFLHDRNQLERIAAAAELWPGDQVIEVGPGLGALTEVLLEKGAKVLAIEKDKRLYDFLLDRFGSEPRLELRHADALRFFRQPCGWSGWKFVSNLPYSVGSAILVELARNRERPSRLVLTVQQEVGERITAQPGGKSYGLLTLLIQMRYELGRHFRISSGCFYPEPDVDSVCLTLLRRAKPWLEFEQEAWFDQIVKQVFGQRRKVALKLLKGRWLEAGSAWPKLGLDPESRAENLSLGHFVELTKSLWRR